MLARPVRCRKSRCHDTFHQEGHLSTTSSSFIARHPEQVGSRRRSSPVRAGRLGALCRGGGGGWWVGLLVGLKARVVGGGVGGEISKRPPKQTGVLMTVWCAAP